MSGSQVAEEQDSNDNEISDIYDRREKFPELYALHKHSMTGDEFEEMVEKRLEKYRENLDKWDTYIRPILYGTLGYGFSYITQKVFGLQHHIAVPIFGLGMWVGHYKSKSSIGVSLGCLGIILSI